MVKHGPFDGLLGFSQVQDLTNSFLSYSNQQTELNYSSFAFRSSYNWENRIKNSKKKKKKP